MKDAKKSFDYESALANTLNTINKSKFDKKLNITSTSHLRHFYIDIKSNNKTVCNIYIKKRAFTFALKEDIAKAFTKELNFEIELNKNTFASERDNTIILDSKYFEKYTFKYEISVNTKSLKKALSALNKVLKSVDK